MFLWAHSYAQKFVDLKEVDVVFGSDHVSVDPLIRR